MDHTADKAALAERWQVLRRRLRELGYIEGTNLVLDMRTSEGVRERLQTLGAELAASRPDVIADRDRLYDILDGQ